MNKTETNAGGRMNATTKHTPMDVEGAAQLARIEANRRVRDAAHDLLAALRAVVGNDNDGSLGVTSGVGKRNWQETMRTVRAAIARAEGRS